MGKTGRYIALFAILTSSFATVLNGSMLRVATPFLLEEFQITYSQLTWVLTSYQIIYAILLPILGQMGDRYGRKKLLVGGLIVFGLGSVLCGFSRSFITLIMARIVQALGAGAIFPNAVITATNMFPPEHRGKIMGFWGMCVSLGSVCGPSIGGFITQYLGWSYLFHVNIPIILFALTSISLKIKPEPLEKNIRKFDYFGSMLLATMIVSFVLALQNSSVNGLTWDVVILISVFLICVPLFLKTERKAEQSVLDLGLFKNSLFMSATICGGAHFIANQGLNFMMPLFLAQVFGMDSLAIGIMMLPQAIIRFFISPLSGVLADKFGNKLPVGLGLIIRTVGLTTLALLKPDTPILNIVILMLVSGTGAALIWGPVQKAVIESSQPEKASSVVGVFNMIRFIMGVTSTVIIGVIMDALFKGNIPSSGPVPGFFHGYLLLASITGLGLLFIKHLQPAEQKQMVSAASD